MNKILILIVFLTLFYQCDDSDGIDYFSRHYRPPYYAINLSSGTPVYLKPGDKEKPIYYLEENRVVQLNGSVSLEKPEPIWYFIQESNVHGYALSHNFKVFETRKLAESFLLKKSSSGDASPALSIYNRAEGDYRNGDFGSSTVKLFRFIEVSGAESQKDSLAYLNTSLMIGRIFIKAKEYQKAITHFTALENIQETLTEVPLLGPYYQPEQIYFHLEEMQKFFNQADPVTYQAKLLTEIRLSKARAYQGLQDYNKADYTFRSVIESKEAVLYKKYALDRYMIQKNSFDRIQEFESLIKKVNIKKSGRYLLFKLGILYEEAHRESEKVEYRSKAADYYRQFIRLFENHYQDKPFPGEKDLYDDAVQKLDFLQ